MNKYTIYCTPTQTKMALKLGAPIANSNIGYEGFDIIDHNEDYSSILYSIIPTAEQMIGWLEEQLGENSSVYIVQDSQCWWSANVYDSCNYKIFHNNDYHSRKEATLAAINAALEYLNIKK